MSHHEKKVTKETRDNSCGHFAYKDHHEEMIFFCAVNRLITNCELDEDAPYEPDSNHFQTLKASYEPALILRSP